MLKLDTVKIKNCGNQIIELSNELNDVIENLYNRIESLSKTKEWQGISSQKFVKQVSADKSQSIDIKNCLEKYGETLISVASRYDKIIKDNTM